MKLKKLLNQPEGRRLEFKAYDFVLRHINQSAITEGVYTKTKWE